MQGSARIDELRQKFHENPRRYFAPLANEYRKAGDPEQAIAICRAHLAQQPGHMSGHVVYGQALYDADRIDESRTVFEKAISLDPDNAIVLRQLGDIARQRGETAEAKHWYGRALDADPHDSEVAAYIAELTEPLTEAVSTDAVTTEAVPTDASAEAQTGEGEVPVATEAPSDAASDDQADVAASEEPATAAASADVTSEESPIQRDARSDTPAATPIVPLADVAWRKTPPHEDSPFVTRTMAELYAKQGYRAAALDVYRQLALSRPEDREILARIEELTREPGSVAEPALAEELPAAIEQPEMKVGQPETLTEAVDAEPVRALDLGGLELGMEAPVDWSDVSDNADAVYTSPSEELEPEPPSPPDGRHFTELELAAGDTWDTDTWGAGFSANESTDLGLAVPDTPILNLGPAAVETVESASEPPSHDAVAQPETVDQPEADHRAEPVDQPEPADQPAAVVETETATETDTVAEPEPVAEAESAAEAEPVVEAERFAEAESEPETIADSPAIEPEHADEAHLVAYSPQPPGAKDLAHYEPRGPTVREFFATLGARRAPSEESDQSFTARAAVPAHDTDNTSDYPLVASAFADLFPDSPVGEEDTRAAFALSGAMSSAPSGVPGSSPPETARNTPSAATPPVENAQESEEDIRRFREWLDGLAQS